MIAARLVAARTARGLAPHELAAAASVAPAQLSRYESGAAMPSNQSLGRLRTSETAIVADLVAITYERRGTP